MDIHGENPFKTKSYAAAAFSIDKLTEELNDIPREKILSIKGIGPSIGKQIIEILDTGELPQLHEIIGKTPPGVIEMLRIKGLGPKKISTVWKEMEIESIGELMYACNENRLLLYKGFGEKTQNNIRDTIAFYLRSQGSFLFAEVEGYVLSLDKKLRETFPGRMISVPEHSGVNSKSSIRRSGLPAFLQTDLKHFLHPKNFRIEEENPDELTVSGMKKISNCNFGPFRARSFYMRVIRNQLQ